jgi:hypothetical protein
MQRFLCILLFIISTKISASEPVREKDSLYLYQNIDTNYVESYRDWLNAKFICVARTNKFNVTDNTTKNVLEYSINTNLNMGFGFSFKGISFEFQYNPPGLNNDDAKFGKSKQLAFATNANGRKFIYDVFYRYNQGYHTTSTYKVPNDTSYTYEYLYRPDIKNTILGGELVYIFNNKRFSSSAPYNLTQKQKKSAGSLLLGTFCSLYAIDADSVIFPDSVKYLFSEEVRFKNASSITWGISCGYTYTFVFARNWFVNLYSLPGLAVQQYYATNSLNQNLHSKAAIGLALQSRFSIGYNKLRYFIGISWTNTNFFVNNDDKSSLNYKNGCFRFYYGHRFDLRKVLKKRF